MKKRIIFIGLIILSTNSINAQSTNATNAWNGSRFIGFDFSNGVNPLTIRTNNITRMHINGATGVTAGFIGIGNTNPLAPVHITGFQQQNAQGWKRGIILSNASTLLWDGGGGQSFFMAHPSSNPNGNWYSGSQNGVGAGAAVDYAMTVYVNNNYSTVNPLGSTQIFKNLLVFEPTFGRRFGVNTQNPQLAAEVYSNTTQMRLSYGAAVSTTTVPTVFTDLQTNANGNLQIMPTGGRVGVNLTTNPTANLDVNGNARIRNVQAATPNSLLIGVNANGASDVNVRRLDFTGNAGQVLLGNGTWGTAPTSANYTASNGVVIAGTNIQLGARCTNFNQLSASRFVNNRAINLNGHSFWMYSGANQNGGVGFGASSSGICSVGNTVEISANLQSAYGNANASGLRLTKLTSASPIIASGTNGVDNSKVLTVDQNGDVVLTDASAGTINGAHNGTSKSLLDPNKIALGQDLNDPLNPGILLNDREVPMNGNDILFTQDGRIGMGTLFSTPIVPLAKLDVRPTPVDEKGVNIVNNYPMGAFPFYEMNTIENNASGTLENYGLGIHSSGTPVKRNTGLFIHSEAQTGTNLGVESEAYGDAPLQVNISGLFGARGYGNQRNIGVSSSAWGGVQGNTAGLFRAGNPGGGAGSNGIYNIGVSGESITGQNSYGVYGTASGGTITNYAGYFNGNVYISGSYGPSDIQLKENFGTIDNALSIINQLQPKTFEYRSNDFPSMNFSEGMQYGLIAQEVQLILPDLVTENVHPAVYDSIGNIVIPEVNFKGLEYEQLIPVIIQAMKEESQVVDSLINANDSLQNQISDLNTRLTQLENCLSGILPFLCQLNNSTIAPTQEEVQRVLAKAIDVQLSDKNNIILNQNVPNPFAEKTVISYSIPESVGKAQIHFYDGKGTLINTVDIVERGSGEINVYANDLSSGVYTYSLVADGQIVSTKRMMKN